MQDYDETNELVIADAADTEEAARNRALMEQLEASIAAAAATCGAVGSNGRGSREKKRGRGRPPSRAGAQHANLVQTSKGMQQPLGGRPRRTVSFADDLDEDLLTEEEYQEQTDLASRPSSRMSKKQIIKVLQRLIENRGQWEGGRARVSNRGVPSQLPDEVLQSLQECETPQPILDLLGKACDISSSLKYFQGSRQNQALDNAVTEVGMVTRLITMLAAVSGLVDAQEGLTKQEIEYLGLDGIAKLPDPGESLLQQQSLPADRPTAPVITSQPPEQVGVMAHSQPFQAPPAPPPGYLPGRPVHSTPVPPQAVHMFNQNSLQNSLGQVFQR